MRTGKNTLELIRLSVKVSDFQTSSILSDLCESSHLDSFIKGNLLCLYSNDDMLKFLLWNHWLLRNLFVFRVIFEWVCILLCESLVHSYIWFSIFLVILSLSLSFWFWWWAFETCKVELGQTGSDPGRPEMQLLSTSAHFQSTISYYSA